MSAITRFLGRPLNLGVITATIAANAMLVAVTTPVVDPDVWWVAAAGRRVLAGAGIPRTNYFSYVEPAHPWIMHEWLLGPAYAALLERFGPACFDALAGGVLACALALLSAAIVGRARHLGIGIAVLGATLICFGSRFLSGRPTGVALLFPLAIATLAFRERFPMWAAATTIGLELVWVNAHGSFPLGVVLLSLAAVEASRDRRTRVAAACLAALATLATPYGLALHRFVLGYLLGSEGAYRAIHAHIREFGTIWQAWGSTIGPVDVVGLAVVLAVALGALGTKRHWPRALFCLALAALAIRQARNVELAGLLAAVLLLPYLDELGDRVAKHEPGPPDGRRLRVAAAILTPAAAIGIAAFSVVYGRRSAADWIDGGRSFLAAYAAVPDGANAYVPFGRAGVAIWYGAPRGVRVYFDPRNDCYAPGTFEDFFALDEGATPPGERDAVLDASGTTAALVPVAGSLDRSLSAAPGWSRAGAWGTWRVYVRAAGVERHLTGGDEP